MLLFVDTEFADTTASELVSIALVSECGQFEFYAERYPLPASPSDFVRAVVYPLLSSGARALPDDEFTQQLHVFFDRVKAVSRHGKVLVAYDHRVDIHLLDHALDGFQSHQTPQPPVFKEFNLGLLGGEYDLAVEQIFESNSDLRARRHHALIDAWVNRDAYLLVRKLHNERTANDAAARMDTSDRSPDPAR